VLVICGVIAALFWRNARLGPDTATLSEQTACIDDAGCVVTQSVPREARADPLRRRYEWHTNRGPRLVTCMRAFVLVGDWACEADVGGFGYL
jgi:hypothetical protein